MFMKVVLELQDQPSNVKKVTVRHDIVIGRGSDCNLRLSAPQISRRHCFLRVGREGVSVTDLDSSNGTFVDGKRLTGGVRQELIHGSVLALGAVRFLIRIKEDAVSEEVLKTSSPKHSSKPATSRHSSESSTVIGDADALLAGSLPPLARAMGMSVEHAGDSADSHEVTADLESKIVRPKAEEPSRQSSAPSPMDSNAEIVERADFESSATIADAADLLEPEEFSSPVAEVSETGPDMADAAPGDMSFFDDHEEDFGPASPQAAAEMNAASHPHEAAVSTESAASDWDFAEFLDDEAEPVEVMEVEEVIDEAEEVEVLNEPQALEVAEVIETVEATPDAQSVHMEFADAHLDAEVLDAVDEVEMFEPEVLQDAAAADEQFFDDVEFFDDEDVVVEMVEEDDVEILASAEAEELSASEMQPEAVAEEPQVVEPEAELDIVSEKIDDDASSWFASGSDDDDDADPELQKFLKGF
jgi:pSer/pThr/pTyr-binding forkhead associated (FHA) protein